MANSTSNLDLILQAQASKEVTSNGLSDAASPAMTYGRRQSTCSGLTWGFYGGNVTLSGGTMSQIANGTLTLTASATNYIVANKATGAVSFSTATTNWNDSDNYWRLYSVVVGAATVTSYIDSRELAKYTGGGSGGGSGVATWGSVGGTLANQTDLQNALNAKAASSHNHSAGDLSGVVKTVNGSAPDGSGNVSGVVNSINGTGPDASGNVTIAGGGDASTNTATSVDGELPLFSGSTGKTFKRATGSGLAKLTSGVLGTATAGTDYASPPSGTSILYGDGAGGFSNVTVGANLTFVAGTLAATGGGGMVFPAGSGIAVVVSGASWGTTLAAPAGAIVGTSDSQALTNKSYNGNTWTAGTGTLTLAAGKTLTANNTLTLAGTDGTTMTFPPASASVGYINVPQNSQSAAYTTVLADQGKHVLHPSADTTARIFTIPANASVAYPIGTAITFVNQNAAGVITIAITSDTMRLAGAGTTGNRTLAANGVATALKITTTEWIISGTGLT